MDLLKTMLENRKVNNVSEKVGTMTINPAESRKSAKQEIIEKKPKHKKLKEHFESIIVRYTDEDDEDSQ